ncbi:hypothetical protein DY000_02029890 [Brassica cretica]|uniref:MSP domain-containing protein n=1 Tax=Brassica cretica TaxID=69181 RepID=A0ABQ7DPB1_BRACR|nr:hypothetical protein DY000_02029890 [Brassica cretica]
MDSVIIEPDEREALSSLVPSHPPPRKTHSYVEQYEQKPQHHPIRKYSLDEGSRSVPTDSEPVYFDSSDGEFSTVDGRNGGDRGNEEDHCVITPPSKPAPAPQRGEIAGHGGGGGEGGEDIEPLPEFMGAGGGVDVFKVPVRAAVNPGRPPCLEIRPHPLRETQTGKFLRNIACTESQLWAGQENGVRFWNLEEAYEVGYGVGGQVRRGDEDTAPFHESVAISPTLCLLIDHGNRLVWSGHKDGKIRAWKMDQPVTNTADDSKPFKERLSWQAHRGPVNYIVISSYGDMWSCSDGGVIKIWTFDSLEKSLVLKAEEKHMAALLVERSGIDLRSQVTVNGTCSISSSDVKFLLVDTVRAKVWAVQHLSFSMWDAQNKDLLKVFNIDGQVENRVDGTPAQGQQVEETKAKFFSTPKKDKSQGFLQRSRHAIMGAAGAVRRAATRSTGAFAEDPRKVEAIAIAADGSIWTGSMNGVIAQWDGNGNRLREVNHHQQAVLCFCTFGDRIYVGYSSGYIQILDLGGKLVASWVSHNEPVIKLAAGGGFIFSLATHGGVRGWYVTSPGPLDSVIRTDLSQKGNTYARQDSVKILIGTWNVGEGRASRGALMSWLGSDVSDVGIVAVGLQEVDMGAGFLAMSTAKETVGVEGSVVGKWWIDAIGNALDERNTFERMGSRQLAGLLISLWAEMSEGKVFQGMREALITFPPTYKFEKNKPGLGGYDSGEKKRIPAWCDRVIFRDNQSTPFSECNLQCPVVSCTVMYEACMDVTESDHKPVRCKLHANIAHTDKSVRRQELGKIIKSSEKLRSMFEELRYVPETSVSTNSILLQSQDTFIFSITNKSNSSRALFNIVCKGQTVVRDDGGTFGLPRWLEVSPGAGMIKPDASVQVKVHHEDSNTSDESFDGIQQQNSSCEEACDKEVTLMVIIQGSCSTRTTSHSIKVRYCFSAAKSVNLAYSKPKPNNTTKNNQEGSTRYQPENYRGGSTRRG